MAFDMYTPQDLYAVMYDERQAIQTNHWLEMFFPNSHFSDQEEILFSKIGASRKIAPMMLPNEPGKPIYRREGERLQSFKPAYTKPKDAVRPTEMLQMQPGELARLQKKSPAQRWDEAVVAITNYHRNSIHRLWDYLGAKAILDGKVTINYASDAGVKYPSVIVDFGRAPGHTITLGSTLRWGDSGVSIMSYIQNWMDMMAMAEFGGSPNKLILGASAAVPFRADAEIKSLMDKNYRGSESVNINRGLLHKDVMQPFTFLGMLSPTLEVWLYTGSFQNNDGSFTPIMDPRDIVMTAPGVDGIKAFGAILDKKADLQAMDIFVKMFDDDDPPATYIMSQSAPLMIPVNSNRTLRARVVA